MCFERHKVPYCQVNLSNACILAQLMCPFAVERQLAAYPVSVTAVSGRDSCSATRYGALREEAGRKGCSFWNLLDIAPVKDLVLLIGWSLLDHLIELTFY